MGGPLFKDVGIYYLKMGGSTVQRCGHLLFKDGGPLFKDGGIYYLKMAGGSTVQRWGHLLFKDGGVHCSKMWASTI